jgi:hypothetical protein
MLPSRSYWMQAAGSCCREEAAPAASPPRTAAPCSLRRLARNITFYRSVILRGQGTGKTTIYMPNSLSEIPSLKSGEAAAAREGAALRAAGRQGPAQECAQRPASGC